MNKIQEILIQNYPYVKVWMQTGIKIREQPDIDLQIVLEKKKNDKRYNLPTCDEVAVFIVPGVGGNGVDKQEKSHRKVELTTKNDELVYINQLSSFYDPMAYVLTFVNGEHGWSPNSIPLIKPAENEPKENDEAPLEFNTEISSTKYVTAMQYYSYLFQQRPGISKIRQKI